MSLWARIWGSLFILALLALGWCVLAVDNGIAWWLGPIIPLRIRLVKKIDLQQEEADHRREQRRRLELDAAAGRVR